MTEAVLSGSYAGFRLVKTRRVVVVEVEVPIEALQRVLDVLGTPDPATETPVAIARLTETGRGHECPGGDQAAPLPERTAAAPPSSTAAELEQETGAPAGASRPPNSIPAERGGKPRTSLASAVKRQWDELTRAQQAGIRCGEERFEEFLQRNYLMKMRKAEHDPAEFVRRHCGVSTRAHLDTDSIAAAMWDTLDAEYRRFAGLEAEPR